MKDTNIIVGFPNTEPMAAKSPKSRQRRRASKGVVAQFKERQRLPIVTMLGETRDWAGNVPQEGMEFGSFYHL